MFLKYLFVNHFEKFLWYKKKKSINDLTINVKCTREQYPLKYTYVPNSRITYGCNLTLLYVSSTFLIWKFLQELHLWLLRAILNILLHVIDREHIVTSALITSLVLNNSVFTFSLRIFRYFYIYFLKN